jgi:hypothetical protein
MRRVKRLPSLYIACSLLLAACGTSTGSQDTAAEPATATDTASPATQTAPAEAETQPAGTDPEDAKTGTEEALPAIDGVCCLGFDLDPGRYAAPAWFEIRFSLEIGEGWSGVAARTEKLLFIGRGENDVQHADHYVAFFAVSAPEKVLRALQRMPEVDAEPVEELTVAGLTALRVDAQASPNPDQPEQSFIAPGTVQLTALDDLVPGYWFSESPEARLRFLLLDVGELDLLVSIEAPPGDFEAFAAEAEALLETLTIDA